ncbi:MAG: hypothetical protein ACRC1D_10500 [Culicoidibacterales bacterium]
MDEKGLPKLDIDANDHGNPSAHPFVPHSHDWLGNKRGKMRELSRIEKQFNKDLSKE